MSGPKYQHWVPCAYLKQFAINGEVKGRNSRVFVTDLEGTRDKKVAKVGGANWTYSRANPELDHEFNDMENDLPLLVEKLVAGESLSKNEKLRLSLIVFDLHHRSAAYSNNTQYERFDAYQTVSAQWLRQILPQEIDPSDLSAYANYLHGHWDLAALDAASGERFVSSDHPSIIFTDVSDEKPILALMPITPLQYAAVYDRSRVKPPRDSLTNEEVGLLNGLQAKRCIEEIYSDHDLTGDEDIAVAMKLLADDRPDRRFGTNSYKPDYYTSDSAAFRKLKFLRIVSHDQTQNS